MSDAFALAAVSAVLRHRIRQQLIAADVAGEVGTIDVTVGPPDRIKLTSTEPNALNIFLHRASRNIGYAAQGLPTRDSSGARVANPPLALDLHYMVSAYGSDPFTTEILLGHAMAALHEEPLLTLDVIKAALDPNNADPSIPAALLTAGLAESLERLRISPAAPSVEDVTRLWGALHAPYRPSAFFDVCVVLVESARSTRRGLPVRVTGSRADALDRPVVDAVQPDAPEGTPITATSILVITGRRLSGDGTRVVLGAGTAPPDVVSDALLQVPVADFVPPVRAGVAGLQVLRDVDLGDPPTPHSVYASDAVPVIVRPTVTPGAVGVDTTGTTDGVAWATGSLPVTVAPLVTRPQRLVLLLNEIGAPASRPPRAFSLAPPSDNGVPANDDDTATVTFAFHQVPQGDYLVRLQVDGADSPLGQTGGIYDSPQVTL